jgi:hypothetical protein
MRLHNGMRLMASACAILLALAACGTMGTAAPDRSAPLSRAEIFLSAADYRRAIEACQQEVLERPSAASYVYLTYVYQALDAYVDSLAKADRWVLVEQLARSLSSQRPDELLEAPDVLARIAKELIQDAAKRQADVAAGMATRLDGEGAARLWEQQTRWRQQRPDGWWLGVPREWGW